MAKHRLEGSERRVIKGAKVISAAHPEERLEVSVLLRRKNLRAFKTHLGKSISGKGSAALSRDEFATLYGASQEDIAAITEFASANGLVVVAADAARRTVVLSGAVAQFNTAFGVKLKMFQHAEGVYRGRSGPILIPASLNGIVEAVLGLDNRPQARTHFRLRQTNPPIAAMAKQQSTSFTPPRLAELYGFPDGDGQGQCVAIIELGGGYKPADLKTYFSSLKIATPSVSMFPVDHAKNQPTGNPDGPDGEVMLDIEVVGAIAPKAKIVVYFAPNTDAGFLDAITTAIHDTTNKPSIISISWGGPESSWTQQALNSFDQAFQSAAALGITVCVAAGDGGSSDGVSDGVDHVDFPASSPNVLACGGTSLAANGGLISSEAVWNNGSQGGATGGGVSSFFALPRWQSKLKVKKGSTSTALAKRGVPDVSADADPETGYVVRIDGTNTVIGGTSAVAPLWAGLIARINASKGSSVGFINATLYKNKTAFNDIKKGNNGTYSAATGWDACTGLGSPKGAKLKTVLG